MVRALARRLSEALPTAETRAGYLLWLSRPRFWFYLAGPVVVGAAYAAANPAELFSPLAVALFAYFLVPANVFLYGVNDAFDADVDAENPKKGEAESPEVRFRSDPVVAGAVVLSGLLALWFVPALPTAGAAALGAWLFLSVEYSAPPLRFKTTPLLDSLSNGLYILPGVIAYVAVAGTLPPTPAVLGGWLWSMGMHTFSAVPDIEPDCAAGIDTTATALGERRSYAYCAACWLAAAVAFSLLHWALGALLLVYPALVLAIAAAGVDADRAYWWFPAINVGVGTALTLAGLWVTLYG